MELMDSEQKLKLVDELDRHNLLFKTLWNTSDVYFTDDIKTAAVSFANDKISFLFNKGFYESLPEKAQLFVVCHEQLHLILKHFERLKFSEGNSKLKNKAADLCVNHLLERNFNFDRTDLPEWERYCWVDTVFMEPVPDNETAEYYYALLQKQQEQDEETDTNPLDDHEYDDGAERPSDAIKDILDKALSDHAEEQTEGMSESEAADWMDEFSKDYAETHAQNLDTEHMGDGKQEHTFKRRNEKTWQTVYRQIPKRILSSRTKQHWMNRDRRFRTLGTELLLPGEMTVDREDRVCCHIYLDTSGSCILHAKYFLESALSLPTSKFVTRMFGFGTRVYELPNEPPYRLVGFGNESYQAVSDHVDGFKNVDAVMVFTDGWSKQVTPKHPNKWYWFITPNGTIDHIDNRCSTYDLTKFNWKGRG
jgi:predicted metal-dependent peptidase